MTIGELRILLGRADNIESTLQEQANNSCFDPTKYEKELEEIEATEITVG